MMKNRIFSLLTVLLLLMSLMCMPVFAQQTLDPNATASITIKVPPEHGQLSGTVKLYRVADVAVNGTAYIFTYTRDFAGMEIPLKNLNDSELVIALALYAADHHVDGKTQTLKNNSALFDVTPGLYLVVHSDFSGSENTFMPFLVCLPTIEDDAFVYDVTATPKTGPAPESPTRPGPTVPPPNGLPQTGQTNWPVPLMAAAGMLLFTAGWLLRSKERRENCDA